MSMYMSHTLAGKCFLMKPINYTMKYSVNICIVYVYIQNIIFIYINDRVYIYCGVAGFPYFLLLFVSFRVYLTTSLYWIFFYIFFYLCTEGNSYILIYMYEFNISFIVVTWQLHKEFSRLSSTVSPIRLTMSLSVWCVCSYWPLYLLHKFVYYDYIWILSYYSTICM